MWESVQTSISYLETFRILKPVTTFLKSLFHSLLGLSLATFPAIFWGLVFFFLDLKR